MSPPTVIALLEAGADVAATQRYTQKSALDLALESMQDLDYVASQQAYTGVLNREQPEMSLDSRGNLIEAKVVHLLGILPM
jgi:hypothetical protein